ncbi:30S ribosomal protein S6 [Sneathiella sp. CAU 1612]|jgi:small subunit ribosomal protein S6|uniref:Small ribosomal subunit protein bS6 n=1 Tax=Sneathiella sedimenti TaxID=2816034 RepID=A0ABS3F7M1_9PROT|nr:30S ribosomal protein S6 [Sneathiella sedimenti]MBO0334510.1 30S ribosomal protein S6 [Sneathiella sedimenti]
MPLYETVIIARQDISTQQVETLTENMSSFITDGGGTVAKVENWGLRNLAYKIKKNRKGHYVLLNLDTPVDAMKEMERNLRLNEDVLRHMTIKVEELEEGDSVMLQSRSTRPERRRDSEEDGDDAKPAKASDDDDDAEKTTDEGEE